MSNRILTKKQAKTFILAKQGLLGKHRFVGKEGVLSFIEQAGCIQYDPIDICGKNAELVLHSRIKSFTKEILTELLYVDRVLVDYLDKNQAILCMNDWPYLHRRQEYFAKKFEVRTDIMSVASNVLEKIDKHGSLSSSDLSFDERVSWYWGDTKVARAALEALYYSGKLVIHHKKGSIKYYDLTTRHVPESLLRDEDVFTNDMDYFRWNVLRRIGSVGLLWNRRSDAFLGIMDFKTKVRNEVFVSLIKDHLIDEIMVEDLDSPLYYLKEDEDLLEAVLRDDFASAKPRVELLAPLDNLLWDRQLIKELFDFSYKWEIYTPIKDRSFGHYVLPLLFGDQFIGRVEVIHQKKERILEVKQIWYEPSFHYSKPLFEGLVDCFERLKNLHHCDDVVYRDSVFSEATISKQ